MEIGKIKEYINGDVRKKLGVLSGYSIVKFLSEVDLIESGIGNVTLESKRGVKRYLIVTGLYYDDTYNPAHLLRYTDDARIDASNRLNIYLGKVGYKLVEEYLTDVGIEDKGLIDKVKLFDTGKLLVMPIKPNMVCNIELKDNEIIGDIAGVDKRKVKCKSGVAGIIKSITWNTIGGKFDYRIGVSIVGGITNKIIDRSIVEYGNGLNIKDIERVSVVGNKYKFIEFSRYGYIKTIKVVNKLGYGVAIDNSFMYSVIGNEYIPIAYWDSKDKLVGVKGYKELKKIPLMKVVEKNIEYIAQHRRYIIPNGLGEYNEIRV